MLQRRIGRNGKLGTWEYTYTHPTPDEHYDAVFVMQGIGHSDDWSITGRELLRVLKPNGSMVLAEIGFGPQFFAALEMDLHVETFFARSSPDAGGNSETRPIILLPNCKLHLMVC
jgi:SAM-dependent methyltransferase